MERRFEVRKAELLAECKVKPAVLEGMPERLIDFAEPFLDWLVRREQKEHARTYLVGLVSDVKRKNTESIAYLHDQERDCLQAFLGQSPWDHQPLLDELAIQVGQELGEPDAVLVFDPSGFPKAGRESVGVARQWCGRLGKVENCQVAVYLGYVAREEHALVNVRLYLPKEWALDQPRRRKCGVPRAVRFRTRHELALQMLDDQVAVLPHGWIAGDDEMGRSTWFRGRLAARKERYLLAVPSNTTIRDQRAEAPEGHRKRPFEQARHWADNLPREAWSRIDVRDAHKGPLVVDAAMTRVQAKTEGRRVGPEEILVVLRVPDEAGKLKYDCYLSNAEEHTPLAEFARVAKAEHRIEECIQRGKSDAGLADYEVRSWVGWHHHQTLSLIATWFLVQEARRGKKIHPCDDRSSGSNHAGEAHSRCTGLRPPGPDCTRYQTPLRAHRSRAAIPLETTQPIGSFAH
jgi:SRSO17 transposase